MDTPTASTEPVIQDLAPEDKKLVWPDAAAFMDDETSAEAIALAAVEILSVLEHINRAVVKCAGSVLPLGVKMAFIKKTRNAVNQLYLGVPNQQVLAVEALVATELFGDQAQEIVGGKENVDATSPEVMAPSYGDPDAFTGNGGVVATGKTSASNPEVAGSNPESPAMPEYPQ